MSDARSFLLLHGWGGSEPRHWQSWLAPRLRARGEDVRFPELPGAERPSLERWLGALDFERWCLDRAAAITGNR